MKFKRTNCDKTKKSYFDNSNSEEDFFYTEQLNTSTTDEMYSCKKK